jgi:hypothetical protein
MGARTSRRRRLRIHVRPASAEEVVAQEIAERLMTGTERKLLGWAKIMQVNRRVRGGEAWTGANFSPLWLSLQFSTTQQVKELVMAGDAHDGLYTRYPAGKFIQTLCRQLQDRNPARVAQIQNDPEAMAGLWVLLSVVEKTRSGWPTAYYTVEQVIDEYEEARKRGRGRGTT